MSKVGFLPVIVPICLIIDWCSSSWVRPSNLTPVSKSSAHLIILHAATCQSEGTLDAFAVTFSFCASSDSNLMPDSKSVLAPGPQFPFHPMVPLILPTQSFRASVKSLGMLVNGFPCARIERARPMDQLVIVFFVTERVSLLVSKTHCFAIKPTGDW